MEEKTIHRLDQIREDNNLSNSEFEGRLGMSNGLFSKSLKNNGSVKDDIVRKVLEVFPRYSLRWVVLGEGDKFGVDPDDPNSLVDYFVDNHDRLMKESRLYKEKIMNIVKDVFFLEYGHLIKKKE